METNSSSVGATGWRLAILLGFFLSTIGLMFLLAPIPQDLAYHAFVDRRSFLGIPNFFDVVSNLPFVLIGIFGVRASLGRLPRDVLPAWLAFFIAVSFVGVGSAYYHWAPDNDTLVWDRLPMTVGFMGLFVALLGEYLDRRLVQRLLYPAILIGACSVVYWHLMDDLRFYAWVQFMPLAMIAMLLTLYRSRFEQNGLLLIALGFYVLAKVVEYYDAEIFQLLGENLSGHTLKHLLASAGCLTIAVLVTKWNGKHDALPA
ncbi:conserved hypothetical protein [Nitrosococcus oceani ATCC 19707]|uniref:Alkaline phytoceramidase n=2 Tax=Nitrosococcus oceani TaxID=1229 RepID=Q3J711_NITOC|nr:ceramidase domain-containing protein [Nitrosococcus oceani]ABA59385.1 conserved hypothetical protein [Nitrosococcus oceani ATCC 19707]EDZ65868.1 hypothetical protein NOC27_2548 [Nitrosococcus oceani AFC27]KFI18122.1 hypothetical protein IB75_15610 [Nitrosococcus oceani C-27]